MTEHSHPVVYHVVFEPAVGWKQAMPYGYDACSQECAEQLANVPPDRSPSPYQLDGHPTDPKLRGAAWIYAFREDDDYPAPTERNGKWLIFLPPDQIDDTWERIKHAVQVGRLGDEAKVATTPRKSSDGPRHVICVYSYDGNDSTDVRRIRGVLREMGFTWNLAWKSDEATRKGQYSWGDKNSKVSRYWE